jgi:hypothetical protein
MEHGLIASLSCDDILFDHFQEVILDFLFVFIHLSTSVVCMDCDIIVKA